MVLILCAALFFFLMAAIFVFGYLQFARQTSFSQTLRRSSSYTYLDDQASEPAKRNVVLSCLSSVGRLLPSSPVEIALQRRELVMAGFRSEPAPFVYAGLKILLTFVLLLAGLVLRTMSANPALHVMLPMVFAVLGFKLPGIVLARLIRSRQQEIRLSLPDALDMLVVCCEAGCALDQAIFNVSREFKAVHPALSEELSTVNMELLAGSSRVAALRNLATRTGEDELKKLVAILIQTDRFGTSVADALRTQADFMRVKRRQLAEEKAGKVGAKLVFPIFFFCMPSLGILVIGPGLLQLMKNFLPALNGMK